MKHFIFKTLKLLTAATVLQVDLPLNLGRYFNQNFDLQ